jgi:hypothetical protein
MREDDEGGVYEVYRAWYDAFQAVGADAMRSLFDLDYPGLVYQSDTGPLYRWDEIDPYWTNAPRHVDLALLFED